MRHSLDRERPGPHACWNAHSEARGRHVAPALELEHLRPWLRAPAGRELEREVAARGRLEVRGDRRLNLPFPGCLTERYDAELGRNRHRDRGHDLKLAE